MENISMDWTNLQFKAKDLILFGVYLISGMLLINKVTNSIDRLSENQAALQEQFTEFKNDSKDGGKETQLFWQTLQNQVNSNTTQIKLQDQRITIIEQQLNKRNY